MHTDERTEIFRHVIWSLVTLIYENECILTRDVKIWNLAFLNPQIIATHLIIMGKNVDEKVDEQKNPCDLHAENVIVKFNN